MLESKLDIIRKKVAVGFCGIFTLSLFFFSIFYWYEGIKPMNYLMTLYFLMHFFTLYIPYALSYQSIKILAPLYFTFACFTIFPIVVLFWMMGQIVIFIWYFLVPLGALVLFPIRKVILWFVIILIFIAACFIIVPYIPSTYTMSVTDSQLTKINIYNFLSFLSLFLYFLYYINKINQVKLAIAREKKEENEMDSIDESKTEDKYNKLYEDILAYFEKHKPYCNPDYTISELASALNSNVAYIQRAIKQNTDMNFNIFINTYRIRMVKEMFDKGYQNTYTIKYIYTMCGFKQQTTFNKVFKQIEGNTPTDYIKMKSEESV